MTDKTLAILVHAESKVGKTTLGATAPKPLLILDAEGGSKFLALRRVSWDPKVGPPPAADGTWDACIVVVRDFEAIRQVFQWLHSGQHEFRAILLDSITEMQRRLKANLKGTDDMQTQDWGRMLVLMDNLIRGFRDLTFHPTNPVQVVVFVAETRPDGTGKRRPYLQGAVAGAVPYWMDVVGYLYVSSEMDADGQPTLPQRRLLVTQHPQFEAGERVQGRLGYEVVDPNIERMLEAIYPDAHTEAASAADEPAAASATA